MNFDHLPTIAPETPVLDRIADAGHEITSLNELYLDQKKLSVEIMYRGFAWLDTGTHESMLEASNFIHTIEKRQGLKVACLEEIAFDKGLIDKAMLRDHIKNYKGNAYANYLKRKL